MSRSKRSSIATETVAICEAARYTTSDGCLVKLSPRIEKAVADTIIYKPENRPKGCFQRGEKTRIVVTAETTVAALLRLNGESGGHLGCLNFASAKNPGGGFLGGAEAQEESLARSSALYPCLLAARDYYDSNRACHSSLYLDLVIWSPAVPFFRDDRGSLLASPTLASVITAPAPNAGAVALNEPQKVSEIESTLKRRAAFVLAIAAEKGVRRLVLGAWGCGVFRNDPRMVADAFSSLLAGEFADVFDQVIFAIYDKSPEQAVVKAFAQTLK